MPRQAGRVQQLRKTVERPLGGRVAQCGVGLLVHLDEEPVRTEGEAKPRHPRGQVARTAARDNAAVGELLRRPLQGVGDVEADEGLAGGAGRRRLLAQPAQVARVDHRVVVAKKAPALAQDDPAGAGVERLALLLVHRLGRGELALLDLDNSAGGTSRGDQVRLPAEERRDLDHVDAVRDLRRVVWLVHVRHDRQPELGAHALEEPAPCRESHPAV
mmetsp:Transcript_9123/g.29348  ORF Transcript_9123/g.29348 Transcript_9123/m.29348 type:complete len:216 (-) Transcript_9123:232-879(-)